MELFIVIPFCLFALVALVGGYVYMFLHIMRSDPGEFEFGKNIGQDNRLDPLCVQINKIINSKSHLYSPKSKSYKTAETSLYKNYLL